MARTDIGPRIGIEGESEFRRQIEAINQQLRTTRTEMQVVTSEFIGNERSTESLARTNAVLERELSGLNERLAVQQQLLDSARDAYGEADSRTQRYQQAVNRTTAEINSTSAAIQQNNTAMSTQNSMLGRLGINLSSVGESLGLSAGQVSALSSALNAGAAACAAFASATIYLATKMVELSNAATQYGDDISTMAIKYSMSTDSIQQLRYMAELTDTSLETVTGSMSKLTKSLDSARNGTGNAAEAFSKLGVSVTNSDGSLRSANDVFGEVIDALGEVGNHTERDALAMDIFGKSAMELNPLIAQGSEGLRELAQEAANSGYVLSKQMIETLAAGDDATQRLNNAMDGLKNTIGAGITPVVAGWKMIIADAANGAAKFIQELTGMRDSADEVAESVTAANDALSSFRDLTAEDFVSPQAQSYKDYVDRALKYQQETGQQVTIYSPQAMQQGYRHDVTLQLDGYTLGRAATGSINGRNYTRGAGI